jgi:hypothetical protein
MTRRACARTPLLGILVMGLLEGFLLLALAVDGALALAEEGARPRGVSEAG